MKKSIIKNAIWCCGLAILGAIGNAWAQTATVVTDPVAACLGPQLSYQQYPREVMVVVQKNLWDIYHLDDGWQRDFKMSGAPLNDGIMGPITWSWMNRFCKDFALVNAQDKASELPTELTRVATFGADQPHGLSVLISQGFANWRGQQKDQPSISRSLYKGSNTDLLALVQRYEAKNTDEPPPNEKPRAANTLYMYVLRDADLIQLGQADELPAAVRSLAEKPFATEADANAAIAKAIGILPKDIQPDLSAAIQKQVMQQSIYQLNEASLSALASAGLSAPQIVELNKIPKTAYTKEDDFRSVVDAALTTAAISKPSTDAESPAVEVASIEPADITLAEIRVLNAAKNTQWIMPGKGAAKVIAQFSPGGQIRSLDPVVIKSISGVKDLEYPDGDLLHHAAQDKLAKELNVCEENKSNSIDIKVPALTVDERQSLRKIFAKAVADSEFKETNNKALPQKTCDENFWRDLRQVYSEQIAPAVELVYRKEAPAYSPNDILWTGTECGCIPDEISATAYGIYPYWLVSDKPQNFDFSTFSRVGYYGFSFNGSGQITQTNTGTQTQTLLDPNANISHEFITVARTFGSKVDWVIEKDWDEEKGGRDQVSQVHLRETLNALQSNIVNLLKQPLKDKEAQLRPWISLGIAQAPTMGDGVTLYFKHYPTGPGAKEAFESFYTELKTSLKHLSDENSKWHRQRQDYFVNLVVSQEDYQNPDSLFNATNIFTMIDVPYDRLAKLTMLEEQQLIKTLVLVLVKDPYYNSLSGLYAGATATNRGYVLPTVFMDYKHFSTGAKKVGEDKRSFYDERRKNVSFLREAFGGGAFWAMPTWDAPDAGEFNNYVATHFALGYPTSLWDSKLCAYRWKLIGIMNLWLCAALLFVLAVFYVFPYRCHALPGFINALINPVFLAVLLLPPIGIWVYLLVADSSFPILSVPSLLIIVLLVLSILAGISWIRDLRQRKPTRNLAYLQASQAKLPSRQPAEQTVQDDGDNYLD